MTIAITTPTGHVGSQVLRLLIQAGERPRVLCRNPSRIDGTLVDRLDAIDCDQTNADEVVDATAGTDALLWIAPAGTSDDPIAAYRHLGEVAARAVAVNSIRRTVFLSSVGAEQRHGMGELDGLGAAEELLDATGASVTHLRCGYFFVNLVDFADALAEGVLPTTFPLDLPQPWVDPRDIATVAAGRLLSTAWSGRVVQAVHGPHDLTFTQAAAIVTAVTGHTVRAERISDDAFASALAGSGMDQAQITSLVDMAKGIRSGFIAQDKRTALTTTPTTLHAWVAQHQAELGLTRAA